MASIDAHNSYIYTFCEEIFSIFFLFASSENFFLGFIKIYSKVESALLSAIRFTNYTNALRVRFTYEWSKAKAVKRKASIHYTAVIFFSHFSVTIDALFKI